MNPRILTVVSGLALALVLAPPAAADLYHYISITGATQGQILGDSTVSGREGTIPAYEYHHLVERPAGQAVQHQTVITTFDFDDRSVPNLMTAMANDESLSVTLTFYRPTGMGAEEIYATVLLLGARVVAIEPLSPNSTDPDLLNREASVRVRFSYTSLQHTHVPTAVSATLD